VLPCVCHLQQLMDQSRWTADLFEVPVTLSVRREFLRCGQHLEAAQREVRTLRAAVALHHSAHVSVSVCAWRYPLLDVQSAEQHCDLCLCSPPCA
jgi:hypothetical protein